MATVHAQSLEVSPARALNDEQVSIRATGLGPQAHVMLRSSLVDGGGHTWSADAEFVADGSGVVDSAKQAPMKGSYRVVSAMGLVWSMKPAERGVTGYQSPHNQGPQVVEFKLETEGRTVASAKLEQLAVADGVKRVQLTGTVHGVVFMPSGDGPHPGVLVLGGSEGGTPTGKAAWLASHGYVAVALAYFHSEGLPAMLEKIPLEYFGQAIEWMQEQPSIIRDEIGVVGTSRGGELALQLGAVYPQLHAVVAYVPANVRYPACCGPMVRGEAAWTVKGQALAFVTPRRGEAPMNPLAEIAVENTHGPIFMIAGDDDGVWESKAMVSAAVRRLERSKFAFPVEHYSYAHAGHRAGLAAIIPTRSDGAKQPVSGELMQYGGTPEGNALSGEDAGPKVLEFLRKSLPAK